MKKFSVAILACYYLVAICGVSVNMHYCMKRLVSTQWFGEKADTCGKCGMDMHEYSDCCHDELKVAQLEEDQVKTPAVSYEIPAIDPIMVTPSEFMVARFHTEKTQLHFLNHSPPLLSAQDTYLQNNVFRI